MDYPRPRLYKEKKTKGEKEMKRQRLPRLLFSIALVIASVSITSCTEQITKPIVKQSPNQIIKDITAQEASELIDEKRGNPNFIIIDVRTPAEYSDGHVANAININFSSDSFEKEMNKLDKDKTYLIYCRSGNRSRGALDIMVKMDFKEIYHLSAGIIGWLEEDFPIAK